MSITIEDLHVSDRLAEVAALLGMSMRHNPADLVGA
jgi:hypothetical protein